jgi:CBS domain-containing protein
VVGILTERDIVRGLCSHGRKAVKLKTSDLMSRALVCTPEVDVGQVMEVMTHDRVRHLVVMVGEELRGVVSIGDVVQSRLDQCQLEVNVLRDYARVRPSSMGKFA